MAEVGNSYLRDGRGVIMIICAGTLMGRIIVGILVQLMIIFAFFSKVYAEAEQKGIYSEIYNMDNCPAFLKRVVQENRESQLKRMHKICATISVILWFAAVIAYFILNFAGVPETGIYFAIGGSLFGVSLIRMLRPDTSGHTHRPDNAAVFLYASLIIVLGLCICFIIDSVSKSEESAEQYTVVAYDLRPIEESVFFRSGEPNLYDADSPGQVHYLVTQARIDDLKDNGYFFLSENSNNLQYIDKDDVSFEYQADAQPKLIERRSWHITKYWKRFKQKYTVDYHVILPSKDYVLE